MIQIILKILLFLFVSIILSYIPVNRQFSSDKGKICIYISSNGVHTDLVMPIKNQMMDWKTIFAEGEFKDGWLYATHIAFGWGDKGFYLKTPEWKDLRLSTALKALFIPSTSAVHVTLWPVPEEDQLTKMVYVTDDEYDKIADYILNSFEYTPDGQIIKIDHPGYGEYDLFFESALKFHLFRTCNVWTCEGLKKAGIRTSLWTPFDRPILYHLSQVIN